MSTLIEPVAADFIEKFIKQNAALCKGVSVTVCRRLPTISIHDDTGKNDDIFMQGDEAVDFLDAFDSLIEKAPDVLFVDALKHLARPYVEYVWS